MKLYRFSPIQSKEALFDAITYIHFACHALCKQSFDAYLSNTGNVGVFCHYDDEYEFLVGVRKELTEPSDDPDRKYFRLFNPMVISAKDDVPETTYTHLYIRKPDPYRFHVGDIDFCLEPEKHAKLKQLLLDGEHVPGARVFERPDLDMIELHDPDIDALAYVSIDITTEKVRIKFPDATTL